MNYKVIGLMSGTSLDGLDLAYVELTEEQGAWSFNLLHYTTLRYEDAWFSDLRNAQVLRENELEALHNDYGLYLGRSCLDFIKTHGIKPDLIASHGHTVFHQPDKGFTYQLGNGQAIANTCGITTVSDFRSLDVSLGGQGAPLVPVGDRYLFSQYDICLNLGGFANVSFESEGKRIAFDISPVNIVLNVFANELGKEYDENGEMAASGNVVPGLLAELNALPFYLQQPPKSLSREWVDEEFLPLLRKSPYTSEDKLRTVCTHIAQQVARSTAGAGKKKAKMLVTGGGTHNQTLIDYIRQETNYEITVPVKAIIEYKEALIFALLSVLKVRGEINCLSSVTGALRDSSCGVISVPK